MYRRRKDGWTLYIGVRGTKIDEIWFEFGINWIEGRLDDFLVLDTLLIECSTMSMMMEV